MFQSLIFQVDSVATKLVSTLFGVLVEYKHSYFLKNPQKTSLLLKVWGFYTLRCIKSEQIYLFKTFILVQACFNLYVYISDSI